MSSKNELLKELSDRVAEMEDEKTAYTAREYLVRGHPALDGVLHGLVDGMHRAAQLFTEDKYFIPELLLCSDAMYAGLEVLRPALNNTELLRKGKIVLGVIEGDTHDIGKNLVKIMLEAGGYEVLDLGRDVKPRSFIDKTLEVQADIIAVSTLMTTTMPGMAKVVSMLADEGLGGNVQVIVGGAAISQAFADKIGADGYSANAVEAVRLVEKLLAKRKRASA